MRKIAVVVAIGGALAFGAAARADNDAIKQEAQTSHYRLVLIIGPFETRYTPAEAKMKHPTSGEVMVSGKMAGASMPGMGHDKVGGMNMSTKPTPDQRHLELHIYSRTTGKTVADAHVTISIVGADKKSHSVPIARMYGIDEGPDDMHFGNNVTLPPGTYTIRTAVNGERASFSATVPPGP